MCRMHRRQKRPTRRVPDKRKGRPVCKPGAHPSKKTAEYYHIPPERARLRPADVAFALLIVLLILVWIWAIGMAYQIGYQAGTQWVS
jgi:hypothetical protein